jgi:hypothetical protein
MNFKTDHETNKFNIDGRDDSKRAPGEGSQLFAGKYVGKQEK